jgi:hypothetical protein
VLASKVHCFASHHVHRLSNPSLSIIAPACC